MKKYEYWWIRFPCDKNTVEKVANQYRVKINGSCHFSMVGNSYTYMVPDETGTETVTPVWNPLIEL